MSRLYLTDLEEFEASQVALQRSNSSFLYPQSVPTLNHAASYDSQSTSSNQLHNEKIWKSHQTLPALRSRRKVPLAARNELKRTRAGFIMGFVLKRLRTPLDGYQAPPPPQIGSYDVEKSIQYLLPKPRVTVIPPVSKNVAKPSNERIIKPRRFIIKKRGEMWPEDNKYGEEEHKLNKELKAVVPNKRLVPIKDSAATYVNKHSYYRTIDTDTHHQDMNLVEADITTRFEEMKSRLKNLKVNVRNLYVI